MLTFPQLLKYYDPSLVKKNPKGILVEYLQHELLDSIFQQKESQYLSFMGGTAIRIVYDGNRFSEDLDFDNFGLSFVPFHSLLGKVEENMKRKGFGIEFRAVSKGSFHGYMKFPKLLYSEKLGSQEGEKILVRINTVRRTKQWQPKAHVLNKFDVFRKILVNPPDIILTQKLGAILTRKRPMGRDFYDVSFLSGFAKPNEKYIREVWKISPLKLRQKIQNKIKTFDFRALARDVEPFLMKDGDEERVKNFLLSS